MLYFQFDDFIFHIHKFLLVIHYNHFIAIERCYLCGVNELRVCHRWGRNELCKMTRDQMNQLSILFIFICVSPHLPQHTYDYQIQFLMAY